MMVLWAILFCFFVPATLTHLEDDSVEYVEPEYLDLLLNEERYEEFNRLMKIDIPHLSRPRSENATGHPRYNPHLEHGDILLTPKQKEHARQVLNFYQYPRQKWKNGIVTYIISSKYSRRDRRIIMECIRKFNEYFEGCIQLVARTTERNYIYIYSGDGCFSNLGCTGGQQSLSLDTQGCVDVGTCLHEIMHAIGFLHEQCRPDRDDSIQVYEDNIKPEWRSQFEKESPSEFDILGVYDCLSLMHYPKTHPDFSVGNRPAFRIKDKAYDNDDRVGNADDCTDTDIEKVMAAYCDI